MRHTVCLLNDSFPPMIDGVANAVVNYGKIIEKNYGHAIVATPEDSRAEDSQFPFPVIRYPSIDLREKTGYMAGIPFSPKLAGTLASENVELLHTHCPIISTVLARELRQQLHAPVVLTYHTKFDIDIANVIHNRLLQEGSLRALVWNINACDAVWTVSRGAGENLRSIGYEGEYMVMPNGVDLSRGRADAETVKAVTGSFDFPEGVPVYLFVGRIMWYKGLRIILDALAKCREAGSRFRMVFVGTGGDQEEVKAYAAELGLEDLCSFVGAVTDREVLRAWYTRADLFLFPSTFDTNGLVVREAAACSLPSVLVRGSCAAEDVTDGRNAFLIEENPDSLASLLLSLQGKNALIHEVGERAGEELYLSWEQAVAKAWDAYEIVLDQYRSGKYRHRAANSDIFFNTQGVIMEELYHTQQREHLTKRIRRELHEKKQELWEQLERYL